MNALRCVLAVVAAQALLGGGTAAGQPKADDPQLGVDRYDDPLPPGAVARLGTTRFRHGRYVECVAFSPDGKLLASGGMPQGVFLWDAATGKRLRSFLPFHLVHHLAFSPDGKLLAAGLNPLRVWDVTTGKLRRQIDLPGGVHVPIAFSPDSKLLASGGLDGVVRLWDAGSGKEVRRLTGHKRDVLCLAFSSDGRTLASGSFDGTLFAWDWTTGKIIRQFPGYKEMIHTVAFSPDGKTLASGSSDQTVRLWEAATGKQARVLADKGWDTQCVVFSPDGKLVAAAGSDQVRFWEAATGKPLPSWQLRTSQARSIAFAPDGKAVVAVGPDVSALRFWDVAAGKERPDARGHYGPVWEVRFSADGRQILSAGSDQTVRRWDRDGRVEQVFAWQVGGPNFAVSRDGARVATAGNRKHEVYLWSTAGGQPRLLGHQPEPPAYSGPLVFSPDGKLLAWLGKDRSLRVWDVDAAQERGRLKPLQDDVLGIAFSPDGKTAAVMTEDQGADAGGTTVRLIHWQTGQPLRTLRSAQSFYHAVFSPDGRWLAGGDGSLWEVATGKNLRPAGAPEGGYLLAFSQDVRFQGWLAHAGDPRAATLHVLESATGREVCRFSEPHSELLAAAFSPDGQQLVTGHSDSTILVWDLTAGRLHGVRPVVRLARADLEANWSAIAGDDAARAHRAVWALAASSGDSVPFLRQRLAPATAPAAERLKQLIADLGDARFAVRERAGKELDRLAELAEPALCLAAAGQLPLEVRQRVEQLLTRLQGPVTAPERLRALRAIAALEYPGTAEAREALVALARGAPSALLTREAQAAVGRLDARGRRVMQGK